MRNAMQIIEYHGFVVALNSAKLCFKALYIFVYGIIVKAAQLKVKR